METKLPKKTTVTSHTITIIPRYCETDQAGIVHHTVYPIWLEMGRTELLRENGIAYAQLEKAGTFFVVADLNIKYRRPAFYDEKLDLETTITKVTSARVEHSYSLKNPSGVILAEAKTTLACVDSAGALQKMPDFMAL